MVPGDKRRAGWLAHAVFFALISSAFSASAQESDSGFQQILPLVPVQDHRPFASSMESRDMKLRPDDDQKPVDSFIQSLKGEDAVIEVIVGRGRLITLEQPLSDLNQGNVPVVAVGDPTVLDFDILPNPRMIRLLGKRIGVTDLSLVTADGQATTFQVQVVYDLNLLRAYLKQLFPDAILGVSQIHEHLVVEGQARDTIEVNKILATLQGFLMSAQVARTVKDKQQRPDQEVDPNAQPNESPDGGGQEPAVSRGDVGPAGGGEEKPDITATLPTPQIINLITVPGVQQIMLKVRIAELDRTALRRVGADWFIQDSSGNTIGTQISSAVASLTGMNLSENSTAFALFPSGEVDVILTALRSNQVLNVLAEPNLVAMHGQEASFLAGGEFPVPVPQAGGVTNAITVEYKNFGVQLNFVPFILSDELIRLHVAPEVSTIDNSIGVRIAGFEVPGVNTRRVKTSVEMHQGQTLAIAGLLQVDLEAGTSRLPGIGDVPIIGPMFSNTSHERKERELLVLVTPFFVNELSPEQVPCLPGSQIQDPTDHEFYFRNRIEGLENRQYRPTTGWNDPLRLGYNKSSRQHNNQTNLNGPYGFSK